MPNINADKTPYFITTAISYVNGPPHLGHAYEAISTDVMARFKAAAYFHIGDRELDQQLAGQAGFGFFWPDEAVAEPWVNNDGTGSGGLNRSEDNRTAG